jgi:hypothetical protein
MVNHQPNLCRVCRENPADTAEHFIPQSAGNKGRVELVFMKLDGEHETRQCSRGFHVPVLCSACNSGVCSVYAQSYSSLIAAIRKSGGVHAPDGKRLASVSNFYRQRFAKHLISMFLCAVPWEPDPVWSALQDYVLDRDAPLPSSAPRLFLYYCSGTHGRIVPCCGLVEFGGGSVAVLSEIAWPPLGVVYAYDWHEKLSDMQEVTSWGQDSFSSRRNVTLSLPELRVNTHFPLAYGSLRQIRQDEEKRLPGLLMHVPAGPADPTTIGALIKQGPRS